MQKRMSQIPIRECKGISLQPDNNRVNLTEGAYQGVVDEEIDDDGGYEETEGDVEPVDPGDQFPG